MVVRSLLLIDNFVGSSKVLAVRVYQDRFRDLGLAAGSAWDRDRAVDREMGKARVEGRERVAWVKETDRGWGVWGFLEGFQSQ